MAETSIVARLKRKAEIIWDSARLRSSIKHTHGPAKFDLASDDVVVVAVIKQAGYYLDVFFDHYRALGVKHFVFVDNGSTDGTLERIKSEPGTIILESNLKISKYEVEFRRHAAQTFARNHWVLFADQDELFDFEGSAVLGVSGLARYMQANGYTALMAQMLDLFPDASIQSYAKATFQTVADDFQFYDLTEIIRYDYHDYDAIEWSYFMKTNETTNDDLKFMFGGVRKKFFSDMCCLTKHPLVFIDDVTWPNPHPHTAAHVKVADFSALLKHYKFTNEPFARDLQTIREGTVMHGADKLRIDVVRNAPDISFHTESALGWDGIEPLYRQGFLVQSPAFTQFIGSYQQEH